MSVPLPEGLKRRLRPIPQWSAIALRDPQDAVDVRLRHSGVDLDITRNNVVAALSPLTIAVGLDAATPRVSGRAPATIAFVDRMSGFLLGELRLRGSGTVSAADARLDLFEIDRGAHWCLPWPHKTWNTWMQNRAIRANADPYNFALQPAAAQQLMIFYLCPRPVVLVSVDDGTHSNLFPMDLIGPIAGDRFTLALRSTSRSVPVMRSVGRIALSSVAAADHQIAYRLGVHHRNVKVDWSALPFEVMRSAVYSLPIPAIALRVREVDVLHAETIGSHTFFVTRAVSDTRSSEAPQFFHTCGIHQYFRTRQGRPFDPAT